jgi:hypothetical protein
LFYGFFEALQHYESVNTMHTKLGQDIAKARLKWQLGEAKRDITGSALALAL